MISPCVQDPFPAPSSQLLGHQHSPGDPAGSCGVTCAGASEARSGRQQGLARWSQGLACENDNLKIHKLDLKLDLEVEQNYEQ